MRTERISKSVLQKDADEQTPELQGSDENTTDQESRESRTIEINPHQPGPGVALLGVRIQSFISGLVEKTIVEQSFSNDEDNPLEITYTFPLPEDAAVTGFEVFTSDRVLTGRVEELDAAVEAYDRAVTEGDAAYMLEQHRPDIFTVNIGSLDPDQIAVLRIEYIRNLVTVDGKLSLVWPTSVAPRHLSDTECVDPHARHVDAEMINPPQIDSVPYGLCLDLVIDASLQVDAVEAVSHQMTVMPSTLGPVGCKPGQSHTRVSLIDGRTAMDRDVLIDVDLTESSTPQSIVEINSNGNHYVAVSFMPDFDQLDLAKNEQSNVVFMVDCSGSMGGQPIAQARKALRACLRSLKSGDRFNIICFGSGFDAYAECPVQYTDAACNDAMAFIDSIDANYGGTELYNPLKYVFQSTTHDTTPGASAKAVDADMPINNPDVLNESQVCSKPARQPVDVVLITDGQLTNESAVIDLARLHKATHRVFTVGIGSSVSRHLCNGLARTTNGVAEYVSENHKIADVVLRLFSRMASVQFQDVELVSTVGSRLVMGTPHIPPLFEGDSICLIAEVAGAPGEEWLLRATCGGRMFSWPVSIDAHRSTTEAVAQMWANQRIEYLEGCLAERFRDNQGRAVRRLQQQVVDLSRAFGILCRRTSFIAVEHRTVDERNLGIPAQRRVPVMMPARTARLQQSTNDMRKVINSLLQHSDRSGYSSQTVQQAQDLDVLTSLFAPVKRPKMARSVFKSPKQGKSETVNSTAGADAATYGLLLLQQADGAFVLDVENRSGYETFVKNRKSLLKIGLPADLGRQQRRQVVPTLYVLYALAAKHQASKSLWSRADEKARDFLTGHGVNISVINAIVAGKTAEAPVAKESSQVIH